VYADGAASRVESVVSDIRLLALASKAAGSRATPQVLVGYASVNEPGLVRTTDLAVKMNALASVPALQGSTRVRATVVAIPHTGEAALAAPLPVMSRDLDTVGGAATLTIQGAMIDAVYVVTLQPAP
jgi:hypothetical protein